MTTSIREVSHASLAAEFNAVLINEDIRTMFQPIISLRKGTVIGYEALSRGPISSKFEDPFVLFQMAEQLGKVWEMEYTCRRLAIKRFAVMGSDHLLFINVNPHVIADPRFREGMTKCQLTAMGMPIEQLVLEITERSAIDSHQEFSAMLEHYRDQGFGLAMDDVGAGYSSLSLVCTMRPKFIKLDMSLMQDIHKDPFKQQLVKFTVNFARATEMRLIAEGIEKELDLLALIDLGVEYGQGYHLGKPATDLGLPSTPLYNQLRELHTARLALRLLRNSTKTVGDVCRVKESCESTTLFSEVELVFSQNPQQQAIPITNDGKPVGLAMRDKFFSLLGQKYGYSLYSSRPIKHLLTTSPLIVDINDPLEEVSFLAMQREANSVYDHILVSNNGMYFGIVTVSELLEQMTEMGMQRAKYANPLTGLPGNTMIQQEIEHAVSDASPFVVLYLDLDNFKAYNDTYGFDRGDEVLRMTANLLLKTFNNHDFPDAFVGHIGGDDYVVVLNASLPEDTLAALIADFDSLVREFYDEEHQQQGYITSINRRGRAEKFPFISISIAVITEHNGPFNGYHAVAKRATEVKKQCKTIQQSCFVHDRRQDCEYVSV